MSNCSILGTTVNVAFQLGYEYLATRAELALQAQLAFWQGSRSLAVSEDLASGVYDHIRKLVVSMGILVLYHKLMLSRTSGDDPSALCGMLTGKLGIQFSMISNGSEPKWRGARGIGGGERKGLSRLANRIGQATTGTEDMENTIPASSNNLFFMNSFGSSTTLVILQGSLIFAHPEM